MNDKITLQDIYAVVNRLEDKMDDRLTKVETRVVSLESLANRAMVIFGIISTVGSAVFSWLWTRLVKNI